MHQLIVKQTGCLLFVQVAPKCLPFAQDTKKQRYLSRKATMGIFGLYERSHIKRYWINQMLYWLHVCICLRLLVWNAGRSHVKKYHLQKKWGEGGCCSPTFLSGGGRPLCPSPSAAYIIYSLEAVCVWTESIFCCTCNSVTIFAKKTLSSHHIQTLSIKLLDSLRWLETVFHFPFQLNFMKGLLICSKINATCW